MESREDNSFISPTEEVVNRGFQLVMMEQKYASEDESVLMEKNTRQCLSWEVRSRNENWRMETEYRMAVTERFWRKMNRMNEMVNPSPKDEESSVSCFIKSPHLSPVEELIQPFTYGSMMTSRASRERIQEEGFARAEAFLLQRKRDKEAEKLCAEGYITIQQSAQEDVVE